MKKRFLTLVASGVATLSLAYGAEVLTSPDGRLVAEFDVAEGGVPVYSLKYDGKAIVNQSRLGFEVKTDEALSDGFALHSTDRSAFDEVWHPVWGEEDAICNHYNELLVALEQPVKGGALNIRFRAYDDGLGFRYEFPSNGKNDYIIVTDELTEFAMAADNVAYWIPGDNESQEYDYTITRLSEIEATAPTVAEYQLSRTRIDNNIVQTSLQMKTDDGLYVNIHEAALVDYPAMHLAIDSKSLTFKSYLAPNPRGEKAHIQAPFSTPWRTIQVVDDARKILASRLILNLNDPCALDDTSWINPMKFAGVWWEMITYRNTWAYTDDLTSVRLGVTDYSKTKPNGRHSANTANVKRYIDFCAENGIEGLLVEGWNEGWEDWFGKEKDFVFDFQTPYPDFDIDEINAYAKERGVKMIMHHETSGSTRNYERFMEEAYNLMNRYGYTAVKSGYVGNILPIGQTHYSQEIINHYLYAVKEAARHKIMVDAHEAVRPTGLCRTYPNLMANESAKGNEYKFKSPRHVNILPFTRLQGGPMDFTPGIFEPDMSKVNPYSSERMQITLANQLALYVTMYSPIQMVSDLPENYMRFPDAFQFIKDVPVEWSRSVYLEAEPAEYVTIARKDKNSDDWYIGSTAGNNARVSDITLDFLEPGVKYVATIYADAKDADSLTNPQSYTITTKKVTSKTRLKIPVAVSGGYAVRITLAGTK